MWAPAPCRAAFSAGNLVYTITLALSFAALPTLYFVSNHRRTSLFTVAGRKKAPHPLVLKSIVRAGSKLPGQNLREICCAAHRSHEPRKIWSELLRAVKLTKDKGLFLDIGTSYDMVDGAAALAQNFTVLAVEGRPGAASAVRKSFKKHVTSGRLTVHSVAVGDAGGGSVQLRDAGDATSALPSAVAGDAYAKRLFDKGGKKLVSVPTVTIDGLVGGRPCAVVKLDIQGAEFEALLGARQLLSRPRKHAPLVVFELYERLRPDLPDLDALHLLRALGYSCYDVSNRQGPRGAGPRKGRGPPPKLGLQEVSRPLATDFACLKVADAL